MSQTDELLRAFLAAQVFACIIFGAALLGEVWVTHARRLRVLVIGVGVVLLYVLAGQAKAYLYHVPFDGYSWVGVAGFGIVIIGTLIAMSYVRRGR